MEGFNMAFMPVLVDENYTKDAFLLQAIDTSDWIVFPYEKFESMNEGDRGLFRYNTDSYGVKE
jgi:hypothetical protein